MVHRFYEEKRGSVAWEVVQLPRWFLRSLETDRFVCSPWGSHTHTRARLLNRLVARLVLVPVCRSTGGNHFSEKTPPTIPDDSRYAR